MSFELYTGDILNVASRIGPGSVDLVVTSPPYAEQRKARYGGVSEAKFPGWMVEVFEVIRPALAPAASLVINIRPHVRKGVLADYTLRTRLALREAGWVECDELVWVKPTPMPAGDPGRPRRGWESLHWFASTPRPWCDPTAGGDPFSKREGFGGQDRGGVLAASGRIVEKHGKARGTDYVIATFQTIDRDPSNTHPAQYPEAVPRWVIAMLCPPGGVVLDPFSGSGTTGAAALALGRSYIGVDLSDDYTDIAHRRLERVGSQTALDLGI